MKLVFVVLATMPFTFSACKSSPAESRKMAAPALHGAMAGKAHGPGMMGSPPAMAGPGAAEPAMAGGADMAAPGAAMAPAMAGGAAPSRTMGEKSKPDMKMAGDKQGQTAGTSL